MAKPIVHKIPIFDAEQGYKFNFTYTDSQIYGIYIIITDTTTNAVTYEKTTLYGNASAGKEFTYEGLIPAKNLSNLSNGCSYTIQVSVLDKNQKESVLSDQVFLTCYSTPIFEFMNLNKEGENKISSASYIANIRYEQSEGQGLKTCRFYLYDSTQTNVIHTSDAVYYSNGDTDISYTYNSLENDTKYYIRCIGETVNDVIVDTALICIQPHYAVSSTYTTLNLTNNPHGGYIQIGTNIVSISGKTNDQVSINDGIVSAIDGSVIYQEGFIVNGESTWILKVKNPIKNTRIAYQSNGLHEISLYCYDYEGQTYFKLTVDNGLLKYVLYSERIMLEADEFVTIYAKRKNNLYQLDLVKKE